MTGFPNSILRHFGFANKADAGELSRGPAETEHLPGECAICATGGRRTRLRYVYRKRWQAAAVGEPRTLFE